jgi:hypothetical protein
MSLMRAGGERPRSHRATENAPQHTAVESRPFRVVWLVNSYSGPG